MLTKDLVSELNALAPCLKNSLKAAIKRLADLMIASGLESSSDFFKQVESLLAQIRRGPKALQTRIARVREGAGEDLEAVIADIRAASATDVKRVIKALGGVPSKTKTVNVSALERHVRFGEDLPEPPGVKELVERFRCLIDRAAEMGFDELDRRLAEIGKASKTEIELLMKAVGFTPGKSKRENLDRLKNRLYTAKKTAIDRNF
jgi:hypothetical protein